MANWYDGLVNLNKYPITDPTSPITKSLIAEYKTQIDRIGVAEIPDFLTPEGLQRIVNESREIESQAHHNRLEGNAYLDDPDGSLPADHVRKMMEPTALAALGYDQIPTSHLLRQIYEWDSLMSFLGAVLNLDKIYRYGDPMGALNVAVMKNGDYLRWHFDQTDFVTSLSIQNASKGGEFEFIPMLRTSGNENYEKVKAAIQGSRAGVVHLENKPGTLVLFKGRYSLHRVTPIEGATSRLMGLLGYDSKPGVESSEYLRKIRYGRTQALSPNVSSTPGTSRATSNGDANGKA